MYIYIKEIELAFENKTRDCWNGKGFSGLSFDGQNNRPKCNAQTKHFNPCNVLANSPLELDNAITKKAAFVLQDDIMLSLAVNSHKDYSVAFIGTSNGKLLKVCETILFNYHIVYNNNNTDNNSICNIYNNNNNTWIPLRKI